MDLIDVRHVRAATSRADLVFAPGERALGGGTWLFSEPQPGTTGLVDLTAMPWNTVQVTGSALVIGATASFTMLSELPAGAGWLAHHLIQECCNSLLGSVKVWRHATVGGNIALALPAGPMTSLAASLDGVVVLTTVDSERRMPVVDFVLGVQSTAIAPDEVVSAVELPRTALEARAGFRRISLSPIGRTGALVIGRVDASGETVFTVTGGTTAPRQLRFDEMPSGRALADAVAAIDNWYRDPHGAPDWRRAMSLMFAEELRQELERGNEPS